MVNEIFVIINSIAPSKKVQCSNKYAPWFDSNYIHQTKIWDSLHKKARITDNGDDWKGIYVTILIKATKIGTLTFN